ncbi:MAG: hypothetical protein U0326_37935 [Polyangiales bacterium]
MSSLADVASLLSPLDAVRRAVLRPFAPWLGRWFRDRAFRVSLAGALSVSVSLSLTAAAPLWLMALGPVVMGVTHLAADARYLVVRQGLHRRALVIALVLAPALVASWRPTSRGCSRRCSAPRSARARRGHRARSPRSPRSRSMCSRGATRACRGW